LCATALLLFFTGCSNDLLGVFASHDFQNRETPWNIPAFPGKTEDAPPVTVPYSFLVVSDIHITDTNTNRFEDIGNRIKEMGDSFAVVTGDITQSGNRQELETFISIAEGFGVPCYPVIGNHDIFFGNWKHWNELIGSSTYRIDSGSTTLLMLDTANAVLGAKQLDWLETQLSTAKKYVFVFTHCNLFVQKGNNIHQLADLRERDRVLSMLDGRCTAMFMGHVHTRILREAGGVQYITLEDFKKSGTYCRVSITEKGMDYEFLTVK
jgi:predicted phosphodiesterase